MVALPVEPTVPLASTVPPCSRSTVAPANRASSSVLLRLVLLTVTVTVTDRGAGLREKSMLVAVSLLLVSGPTLWALGGL